MLKCNGEIKFIIKPEEKMVIGIMWPYKTLDDYDDDCDGILYWTTCCTLHPVENPIKAIARCTGDDEFDEEIGKKIVRAKLYKKWHNIMLRQYNKVIRKLEECVNACNKEKKIHTDKIAAIDEDYVRMFVEGKCK